MFDLEKLKDAYCGDITWLEELERQVIENHAKIKNVEVIYNFLRILWRMNYVVVETETKEFASKYNGDVYEVYRQMKLDLTEMLGISEFWEML